MQKLDAERLTISAPQDADDLTDRAKFKSEHFVEKNRPVEIGLAEAIGRGVKFLLVVRRLQGERIEVGVEMPAGAIGANEHQRPHRVPGRALDIGGGKLDAFALRLRLHLAAQRPADFGPVAVERGNQFGTLQRRPAWPRP